MRRVACLLLVTAAAVAAVASALASMSPKAVRASIVRSALAQKSVHWAGRYSAPHYGTETYSAAVNRHAGTERQTIPGQNGARSSARIRLVQDTAYVNGDAWYLVHKLHLTEAEAEQYAGQWISVQPSDGKTLYRFLADGLTLSSVVHDVTQRGIVKLKVSRRKSHGRRLLHLRGNATPRGSGLWALDAHARGRQLPVAWSWSVCCATSSAVHFSKWNKPVHVHAPASSTPIATVRGG